MNPHDFKHDEMEIGELRDVDKHKGIIRISHMHHDVKTSCLSLSEFSDGRKSINYFWTDHSYDDLEKIVDSFSFELGKDSQSKMKFESEDMIQYVSEISGNLRKWIFLNFTIVIGYSRLSSEMLYIIIDENKLNNEC